MMAITGGRARTKPEMEALLASAGLAPAAISLIDGGLSLIDTTRP